MRPENLSIRRIAIPVLGSHCREIVVEIARSLLTEPDGVIDLLRVDPPAGTAAGQKLTWLMMEDESLNREAAMQSASPDEEVDETPPIGPGTRWIRVESVSPAAAILHFAVEEQIDLLVLVTHTAHGLGRPAFGGIATEVARWSSCPVLSIPRTWNPGSDKKPIQTVLAPIDFSEPALKSLYAAHAIALALRARLKAVHVVEERVGTRVAPGGKVRPVRRRVDPRAVRRANETLSAIVLSVVGSAFDSVERSVRSGRAATEILACATEQATDLTVVGAQGLTSDQTFALGSVADRVLRRSPGPVLLVK